MAHYKTSLTTPQSADEVFSYLSDFSNTQHWDPGVKGAKRLDSGQIGVGSRFEVTAVFMGSESKLVYEITEFEPERRVFLRGENARVISLDEILCEPSGDGARISYDARLQLKGIAQIFSPLLSLAFKRIGDKARDGLARTFA